MSLASKSIRSTSKPTILSPSLNSKGRYGSFAQTVNLPALINVMPSTVEPADSPQAVRDRASTATAAAAAARALFLQGVTNMFMTLAPSPH